MKVDVKIVVKNEDGSSKSVTDHEIHFGPGPERDAEIDRCAREAINKFKASGEIWNEVIITEKWLS